MRYLIAEYKTPEEALNEQHKIVQSGVDQFNAYLSNRIASSSDYNKKEFARYGEKPKCIFYESHHTVLHYCKNCGAELLGQFSHSHWAAFTFGLSSFVDMTSLDKFENFLKKHYREFKEEEKSKAETAYKKAVEITHCPICGAALSHEKGFFLPDGFMHYRNDTYDKAKKRWKRSMV